jgi:hypothetical protein
MQMLDCRSFPRFDQNQMIRLEAILRLSEDFQVFLSDPQVLFKSSIKEGLRSASLFSWKKINRSIDEMKRVEPSVFIDFNVSLLSGSVRT